MTPILVTKKKNGLHFLTRVSFMEASAKTESNRVQTFTVQVEDIGPKIRV